MKSPKKKTKKRQRKIVISIAFIVACAFVLWLFVKPHSLVDEMENGEASTFSDSVRHTLMAESESAEATTSSILEELFQNMVYVEGGTFLMGSNDDIDYAKPVHQVTLDSFYIGKFEVTQRHWEIVMGINPSYFKGKNLPVETVNWNDVQKFILRLNTLTGKQYRLPTEAEWEFAARGGKQSKGYIYSGSNTLNDVSWYFENSKSTQPVGTKAPNELGIFDMSGNVLEWCNDWWGRDYYTNSPKENPQGPLSGEIKVMRGGCWIADAKYARTTLRSGLTPTDKGYLGFRLALSLLLLHQ